MYWSCHRNCRRCARRDSRTKSITKRTSAVIAARATRPNAMSCWRKSKTRRKPNELFQPPKIFRIQMSKTLYLSPPSFDGFDGGAGARYQARREVTSYWYPTWLAQPAALTPNSKLLDCPPHDIDLNKCLAHREGFRSRHHQHLHAVAEKRLQGRRGHQGAEAGHENRFRRRAHDGFADGNVEGVARD